jgi:rhodanese-related sulfurtransferase
MSSGGPVPKLADTADVRDLKARGAQLVEVLPRAAYEAEHLPGAVSIPLASLDAKAADQLDAARPIVVYCYDHECDLSSRAAQLLECLGFTDVYDYVASKVAWMALGLPVEGDKPTALRAGALARAVPTCPYAARIGDLHGRLSDGTEICVVTSESDVVLGVVRDDVLLLPAETLVADVMQAAPPTVRPSISAPELSDSMRRDERTYVLVTLLDGTLVGIIRREDLYG